MCALTLAPAVRAATAPPACDRAISYVAQAASGNGVEWHVYDPAKRTDERFLTLPGMPSDVAWDTAYSRVEFFVGRTLYRAPWRAASRASAVSQFPEQPDACFWWFAPDRACWQFVTEAVDLHIPFEGDPSASAGRRELWRSSPDGKRWRFVQADTVVMEMPVECRASGEYTPTGPAETRIQPDRYAPPLSSASALARTDPAPDSEEGSDWELITVPLESAPGIEVQMYNWWSSTDWSVSGPALLLDTARGTKRVLCAPKPGAQEVSPHCGVWITEACGLLLVNYCADPAKVVDARTGVEVSCLPQGASSVMVTPRLRP